VVRVSYLLLSGVDAGAFRHIFSDLEHARTDPLILIGPQGDATNREPELAVEPRGEKAIIIWRLGKAEEALLQLLGGQAGIMRVECFGISLSS
jgi:hypothetical protein